MQPWYELPIHRRWLQQQTDSLVDFGRSVAHPMGGAAYLDDSGAPEYDRGVETWITSRMVHVYSLAALSGTPGARPVAEAALSGLTGVLRDAENGGWFTAVGTDGAYPDEKSAYAHAFVVLAASSAARAGLPGASDLLAEALEVLEDKFWDEQAGKLVDTWDAAFSACDPYRGINCNMHGVEAMLAAADVTGDLLWLRRALSVCRFVVEQASQHGWSVPEHYDSDWQPLLAFNDDRRDDQFKPYGVTIGHGFEWARLILHTEAALEAAGLGDQAEGLYEAARELFASATAHGWAVDGADGFVYTTDWDGTPIVRQRMHWVAAEAVGAAATLSRRSGGEQEYADRYAQWWDYVDTYLIDHDRGSWFHELDTENKPAATVWPGKADLYHAVQTTYIPRLPLAPSLATAIAEGNLS